MLPSDDPGDNPAAPFIVPLSHAMSGLLPPLSSPPRPRILYYNHTQLVSGAEAMLLNLLRILDRTRYEPIVACPTDGKGNLDELVTAEGVTVLPVANLQARFTSNPIQLVRYLVSFTKTILAFRSSVIDIKPNLLHANSVRAGIVASIATIGTGIPILWHIQDDLPHHPISSLIRRVAYATRRTRFVAVSKATAKAFAGSLDFGDRLTVLYNAIDLDRFPRKTSPLDLSAQAFRDELALAPNTFLIVAVGMINPRKGLDTLLRSIGHLRESSTCHLAIVGAPIFNRDDLHKQDLHTQALLLGLENVTFTGPRKDVPAVLRAADLLVLNATAEPFGLVLVEAMSSGTPVLATDVGGIPEIVTDNETGFLTPANNPQALASRIAQIALAPEMRDRVAANALDRVCPRFALHRYREALTDFYASLYLRSYRDRP